MQPRLLLICLLLCAGLLPVLPQDTTLALLTRLFTERHSIHLLTLTGWVYKPGHNPVWASQSINTTGWTKRQPGALSAKDANTDGKAEGWFRLRIHLDSTVNHLPLGAGSNSWAASEVYVNGQRAASFGNTGVSRELSAALIVYYSAIVYTPVGMARAK